MQQREHNIHMAIAGFIRAQYPDVIFRTDFAAGIKMTMGQAVKHKRLQGGRAYPDLFIAQPMGVDYHGMYIELKAEGATVYLKNGQLSSNPHIREQAEVLDQLDRLGYFARFAVGFDQAVDLIRWYLAGAKYPAPAAGRTPVQKPVDGPLF